MNRQEIRIECLKVAADGGLQEPVRLIAAASKLEEWILAAPSGVKGQAGKSAPRTAGKTAD